MDLTAAEPCVDSMSKAELMKLISTIPTLTKTCVNLQGNLISLRNEYSLYRIACERRFNAIEQYSRRNSIIIEYITFINNSSYVLCNYDKYILFFVLGVESSTEF